MLHVHLVSIYLYAMLMMESLQMMLRAHLTDRTQQSIQYYIISIRTCIIIVFIAKYIRSSTMSLITSKTCKFVFLLRFSKFPIRFLYTQGVILYFYCFFQLTSSAFWKKCPLAHIFEQFLMSHSKCPILIVL